MAKAGGARPGAGRKPAKDKMKVKTYKAYDWEFELIKANARKANMSVTAYIKYKTIDAAAETINEAHTFFLDAYLSPEPSKMIMRSLKAYDWEWDLIKTNAGKAGMTVNAYIRLLATEPLDSNDIAINLEAAYKDGCIKPSLMLATKLLLYKE